MVGDQTGGSLKTSTRVRVALVFLLFHWLLMLFETRPLWVVPNALEPLVSFPAQASQVLRSLFYVYLLQDFTPVFNYVFKCESVCGSVLTNVNATRSQRVTSGPSDLELQGASSKPADSVGVRKKTVVPWRAACAPNSWAIPPVPLPVLCL